MNWLSVYYPFTTNELFSTYSAIIWTPDTKDWLIGKDRDAGKDWRWEEKGTTEEELVGWHHELDGHEFEQAPGVGDGQGRLVCCSPWDRKDLDMTEKLNWTELSPYPADLCVLLNPQMRWWHPDTVDFILNVETLHLKASYFFVCLSLS